MLLVAPMKWATMRKAVGANLLFGVDNLVWLSIFYLGNLINEKKGWPNEHL